MIKRGSADRAYIVAGDISRHVRYERHGERRGKTFDAEIRNSVA